MLNIERGVPNLGGAFVALLGRVTKLKKNLCWWPIGMTEGGVLLHHMQKWDHLNPDPHPSHTPIPHPDPGWPPISTVLRETPWPEVGGQQLRGGPLGAAPLREGLQHGVQLRHDADVLRVQQRHVPRRLQRPQPLGGAGRAGRHTPAQLGTRPRRGDYLTGGATPYGSQVGGGTADQ